MTPTPRTGDTVLHRLSQEVWTVAYVRGEHLAWVGWPEGEARLADCDLIETCDDATNLHLLRRMAAMQDESAARTDARKRYAIEELKRRGLEA